MGGEIQARLNDGDVRTAGKDRAPAAHLEAVTSSAASACECVLKDQSMVDLARDE